MTKHVPLLAILLLFMSCKDKNKVVTELVTDQDFFYSEKVDSIPEKYKNKFPDWVQIGVECFGVLTVVNDSSDILNGFPIPCKIISFHTNGVKCKTTHNFFPYEEFGCNKMGIRKGETWLEDEGLLFRTRKEAYTYLRSVGAIPYMSK